MAFAYVKPSAPLPPPLLVTTMGCSTNLCLVMMLWTARAKLSVPPPGPAVAMNSIGLTGWQAAFAAPARALGRAEGGAGEFRLYIHLTLPLIRFHRVCFLVVCFLRQLTSSCTTLAAAVATAPSSWSA